MSHANGKVRFNDGSIKHFEYNGSDNICIPKLYDTYDEMIENWRSFNTLVEENNTPHNKQPWYKRVFKKFKGNNTEIVYKKIDICNHNEEPVEIYTDYGLGFYWSGTACRKCMMIVKGKEPFENNITHTKGVPEWVEKYYD